MVIKQSRTGGLIEVRSGILYYSNVAVPKKWMIQDIGYSLTLHLLLYVLCIRHIITMYNVNRPRCTRICLVFKAV